MPMKTKKRGAKSKPVRQLQNQSSQPDPFVDDVDNTDGGWSSIVNILCDYFQIPDLTKRSGLKKVHANFDKINGLLNTAYKKNQGNERILGGIVGIYSKMCADAILRDKLFKEGVLFKLIPLLDIDTTRHLALRALSYMTHHGGPSARTDIARQTPALIRTLKEHPDPKTAELAISTLAHVVSSVVNTETTPDRALIRLLDIPALLRLVVAHVANPAASRYLIHHAIELIASTTLQCAAECRAYPPSLTLLAGCLRSADISLRISALGGLIRLPALSAESDQRGQDPHKIIAAVQHGFPEHLSEAMLQHGPDACDTVMTLKTSVNFQKAMMRTAQDHDLYTLGVKLAGLIVQTEFSIAEGAFQSENPRTGRLEIIDLGLPFKMWSDALPHCARALRARAGASKTEEDMADMLQIKYFIIKERVQDGIELAKRALERSPDVAYFYYVVTLGSDGEVGLRYAKKGIKSKNCTVFVRLGMLYRAVDHAGDLGMSVLQSTSPYGRRWEEGLAFLMSAHEDAKAYVGQAPPDARRLKNVLYWYILLTIAIRGPEMSESLHELQSARDKLKLADDFCVLLGNKVPQTQMRLVCKLVLEKYREGIKEWGSTIARFDALGAGREPDIGSAEKAEDDLAAWLEDAPTEDGEVEGPAVEDACTHPKISFGQVELYRCSWCRTPSAVLRKCGRCAKTRYCDGECQKRHWPTHKSACQSVEA